MGKAARPASDSLGPADRENASPSAAGEKRKRGFPAPVTILTVVLILVWIAAFLSRPANTSSTAAAARSPAPFDTSRTRSILAGGFKIFCLRP